jgi:hypothetical protein
MDCDRFISGLQLMPRLSRLSSRNLTGVGLAFSTPATAIDFLIIGGGGAGGSDIPGYEAFATVVGGGGGAGRLLTGDGLAVTGEPYSITLGIGGVATKRNGAGDSGGTTSAFGYSAAGGGGGANGVAYSGWTGGTGLNGARGGGGSGSSSAGGSPGGAAGGTYVFDQFKGGGGGGTGGTGEAGTDATFAGGRGGPGTEWYNLVTYGAGGGGGYSPGSIANIQNATPAQGGSTVGGYGGGRVAGVAVPPTTPAAFTGSGGGGASLSTRTGTNGSSGVVVIRYPDTFRDLTFTGTFTASSSGGYRYFTLTSSGTLTF